MDAQFRRASRAVDRTVSDVAAEIDELYNKVDRLEAVAPDTVREWFLSGLVGVLLERVVDKISQPGDATLKLSNALADYRDSQWEER
jgi:hypothetical protein